MIKTAVRPELEPMPPRIAALPVCRGYPVPWFVEWIDGEPEFRAMSREKFVIAIQQRKCWVCGERMGKYVTFIAGPMCGLTGTTAEPPSHLECARWSARNCPFLNNPDATRRPAGVGVGVATEFRDAPGVHIKRNPGVSLLWTTLGYRVFSGGNGPLIEMYSPPSSMEWYYKGRMATREEVEESIRTGLPFLIGDQPVTDDERIFLRDKQVWLKTYMPFSAELQAKLEQDEKAESDGR